MFKSDWFENNSSEIFSLKNEAQMIFLLFWAYNNNQQ